MGSEKVVFLVIFIHPFENSGGYFFRGRLFWWILDINQKFLSWINTSDLDAELKWCIKKRQGNYFGNQFMDSYYMMSQEKNGIFSLLGVSLCNVHARMLNRFTYTCEEAFSVYILNKHLHISFKLIKTNVIFCSSPPVLGPHVEMKWAAAMLSFQV